MRRGMEHAPVAFGSLRALHPGRAARLMDCLVANSVILAAAFW
jgi:hypothetical protein